MLSSKTKQELLRWQRGASLSTSIPSFHKRKNNSAFITCFLFFRIVISNKTLAPLQVIVNQYRKGNLEDKVRWLLGITRSMDLTVLAQKWPHGS